ncbi:MAG: transporter substrate-binding domain-containing protein, partial [Rhodospirillales bacterium]|nr:transporter substrate-binding domain-containing protein [Rhodospirillales bacterium]
LGGATVCVQTGTTTELNLADFFRANKMEFKPVTIEKYEEVTAAYLAGRCDAITSDKSQLAAIRADGTPNPEDHVILPELISKEPLGPAVRHGDDQWFDLVKWSFHAMIEAEERGITTANIDEQLKNSDPNVQRLLGVTPGLGKALGVDEKWAYGIIKQVGNYGESFERNVGLKSKLKLERGLNALWNKGGLQYAPPAR